MVHLLAAIVAIIFIIAYWRVVVCAMIGAAFLGFLLFVIDRSLAVIH